jgi:murein DD-endopeptidase MepM/ murein hydrolase activator NlpD
MLRTRRVLPAVALFTAVLSAATVPLWVKRHPTAAAPQEIRQTGRIGRNGSLYASLASAGVGRYELSLIDAALRKVFDPRRVRPKDAFEVSRSPDGAIRNIKYWPGDRQYVRIRPAGAGYAADLEDVPLKESEVGASGTVTTSLWDAMIAQKVPPDVIMRFADVFAWQVDFLTEPRPGDTFKLVWKRQEYGSALSEGDIELAQYRGQLAGDRAAVLFDGGYYDLAGDSLRKEFLRAPLNYRRISSKFTERRYHPILKFYRPHHGIDYAAAYGTPVASIGEGVVVAAGWNGGIGRMIEVRHNSTYASIYGHLSRFASGVRPGRRVRQGQVIGYVGSTGLSTGPHLHFGFKKYGRLVNFFALEIPAARRIDARDLTRFQEAKRQGLTLLAQIRGAGETLASSVPAPSGGPGGASR